MAASSEEFDQVYDEALRALGGLINQRKRADGSNWGDAFNLMREYVKILNLEEVTRAGNIIHVAGTKGKGSTCAFAESVLRSSGFTTGLFTSPHLVDVRERFRINGELVPVSVFLDNFWWCYKKCEEATEMDSTLPMPAYFRFLTLLSLRLFSQLKVDVILLEVGIGGRFDATNVVTNPAVCGISTLGYDHMELLGDTLALIAGEKAGIFKPGVPAITSPQESEAMEVLEARAKELQIPLTILKPGQGIPESLSLGLAGSHQRINASLAVALAAKWAERTGRKALAEEVQQATASGSLTEAFTRGLQVASWPGRCQIIRDSLAVESLQDMPSPDGPSCRALSFFLDGAHTLESMEVCANWFCEALAKEEDGCEEEEVGGHSLSSSGRPTAAPCTKILLFNCMPERDPEVLFSHMINTLNLQGVSIDFAIFAPPLSSYTSLVPPSQKVSSAKGIRAESASCAIPAPGIDLSWQLKLQSVWDRLGARCTAERAEDAAGSHQPLFPTSTGGFHQKLHDGNVASLTKSSAVLSSLPAAISLLRRTAKAPTRHIKVLVTGSLHLVGDVLRLLK